MGAEALRLRAITTGVPADVAASPDTPYFFDLKTLNPTPVQRKVRRDLYAYVGPATVKAARQRRRAGRRPDFS